MFIAVALAAFGVMAASRMTQVESFQVVMQFFVLPMFFLSGAFSPSPTSRRGCGRRRRSTRSATASTRCGGRMFARLHNVSPATMRTLAPGMHWNGWRVPTLLELATIFGMGVLMISIAIIQFQKAE